MLLNGDLAKNGKQQFLAANVVPKTSKNNNIAGTIITRAVIAQNEDGQWKEIFRCDEHLKNAKGFLGGTPMSDVAGWRIAYEQDPAKGLALYLTPLKGVDDPAHSLPIGVRYNPTDEALSDARSHLRTLLARTADDNWHAEVGSSLNA